MAEDEKPGWFQRNFGTVTKKTEYKYAPPSTPDYGEFDWRSMQFDPKHSKNASRFYHSRVLLDAQNAYAGLVEDNDRKNRHGAAWGNVQWGYHWLEQIIEARAPQIEAANSNCELAKMQYDRALEQDKKREPKLQGKSEDIIKSKRRLDDANKSLRKLLPKNYPVNFDGHKD